MNTIYITIENLIATAGADAMIVSENTGYQIEFTFDADWDAYPQKTAVFLWYRDSLPCSRLAAFEGNTVAVPQVSGVNNLYVGVTAGDLQTTTPAQIKCRSSILSSGGTGQDALNASEYVQLLGLIQATQGVSAYELAVLNGYEGTQEEWLASLNGRDGYTPVKGEDYFTEEEIQDVVARVLAEIPAAEETVY